MDTEKKFGLKKSKAIMLFIQMIFILMILVASIYLLVFVIKNKLGGWMISSYIMIILSILIMIYYCLFGFRHDDTIYQSSMVPFLAAVFINIMLPTRGPLQVGLLTILFTLGVVFIIKQKDYKFGYVVALSMATVAMVFSVYSSITADTQFLGDVSTNWPTYLAMYLSIFIPTIMSVTIALAYTVRKDRKNQNKKK